MTLTKARSYIEHLPDWCNAEQAREIVPQLQTAIYFLCGGGHIGDFAVTEPSNFYIDRAKRKLPSPRKRIHAAVMVLKELARVAELKEPLHFANHFWPLF